MLSTAPGFSKGKRVTGHDSILAQEVQVFPKGWYQHELNESTEQMVKISFISL